MRALICEAPGELALREVAEPSPGRGEVIVRVAAALTCGTDLKLLRRGHPKIPFPVVLGHEFAGVVASVGEGAPFSPGDRVTSSVSGPCGRCEDCRAGRENLCATAFERPLFGAFADSVRVPARVVSRGLRILPKSLGYAAAALLDPLASVVRGVSRLPLSPPPNVVLYGAGPIALLFVVLLRRAGATRVFAVGRRPGRLATLEAQGAIPIDRRSTNARARIRDATRGRGAEVVVDTTGDPTLVPDLFDVVARGGNVMLFAGMPKEARLDVEAQRIHYDEITLSGSFHYTAGEADQALSLLASDAIPVDALVSGTSALEAYAEVFERIARGDAMKIAFVP